MKRVVLVFFIVLFMSVSYSCTKKATVTPVDLCDGKEGFHIEMSNRMEFSVKSEDYEVSASTKKDVPDTKVEQDSLLRSVFGPALAILPFVD